MNDGDRGRDQQADAVYPSDPLGLLESMPELERFLSDRRVRGGIERGRPNDVYRALYWARLRGSFPKDREILAMLLSKRRLFVSPMNGAPTMQTINGVGARVYGESERGDDGAYVGTHYFVFLYVPLFPIASYLMATAGANAYRFFGRAPFDTLHWIWNRLVVFGVLGTVLAGLMLSLGSVRQGRITVVNGLPYPVTATFSMALDERSGPSVVARVVVPPSAHETVDLPRGMYPFAAHDPSGGELSSGVVRAEGGSHHTVWNVMGVAPLYLEEIVYSAGGGDMGAEPEIYCGQELIDVSRVDYFLRDPPREISLSRRTGIERRSHFGLAGAEEFDCVIYRLEAGDGAVVAVAERIAAGAGFEPGIALPLARELASFGNHEAALALSDRIRERHGAGDDGLEVHLEYQRMMLRADRRDALLEDYAERSARLDDGDSHYLYQRLARGPDRLARWALLAERFPAHHAIALAQASTLCDAGTFEEASLHYFVDGSLRYDAIAGLEETSEVDRVLDRTRCLFAAGRRSDALLLLDQRFASSDAMLERVYLAAHHELLGREMDPPWPSGLMAGLPLDESGPWRAVYAAMVGREPAPDEMDAVSDPGIAALVATMVAGRHDPDAALTHLRQVPSFLRHLVPPDLELALLAHAERHSGGSSQPLWADGLLYPETPTFIAFVATGLDTAAFADLPRIARATAYFMRSRDPSLDEETRSAALRDAHRLDVHPSWLSIAEEGWPSP